MTRRYTKADLRALSNDLGAELPAPKPKRKSEEFAMQTQLFAWWKTACVSFDVPEFLLWHTPNGTMHSGSKENRARVGAMMKRAGCRSGVPDVFLAVPKFRILSSHDCGLFIELKAAAGKLSPEQERCLRSLSAYGYQTAVCRTLEDAQRVITEYLK